MKTNFKRALAVITGFAIVFGGINSASAETLIQKYFKNNPTSVQQLEEKWGKPVSVKSIAKGLEKRIYGEKDAEIGYNYFIIKDGKVIDEGVTPFIDKEVKKAEGPQLSRIMSHYYKENNVSIQSRIDKYGKPISIKKFPNGMERVVFNYGDDFTGKKFFIVFNGRVLDAGMTKVAAKSVESDTPSVSPFMEDWFKKHPMSMDDITAKYGAPISSETYKNGLVRTIYGPRDAVAGYRFFITKNGMAVDSGLTD